LLDDERTGLKSYVALWMRIQNEIISSRFNKFSDFCDMDRFSESTFDNRTLVKMSERLAYVINRSDDKARPISESFADKLLTDVKHTAVSLPRQIGSATINCCETVNMEVRND
jgi:hypothetical protein